MDQNTKIRDLPGIERLHKVLQDKLVKIYGEIGTLGDLRSRPLVFSTQLGLSTTHIREYYSWIEDVLGLRFVLVPAPRKLTASASADGHIQRESEGRRISYHPGSRLSNYEDVLRDLRTASSHGGTLTEVSVKYGLRIDLLSLMAKSAGIPFAHGRRRKAA